MKNQKGNILITILSAFALIAIILLFLLNFVPSAKILVSIILVFMIFSTVRGYLGDGILTIIFSGLLVYFLVIKYFQVTFLLYVFLFVLMSLQVLSLIIWGIGSTIGRKH